MKKAAMAIMLAALLAATIVGVVWARPNQIPQAAVTTRKVTIGAAFFQPPWEGIDWNYRGGRLALESGSNGDFAAPVVFPTLSSVTVKKVTLSVDDANAGADACVALYRTSPRNFSEVQMAAVCSSGSGGESSYDDDTIDSARVYPAHVPYLWVTIDGTNIAVTGVTIEYQINTSSLAISQPRCYLARPPWSTIGISEALKLVGAWWDGVDGGSYSPVGSSVASGAGGP